jgi:hypothetical protein
LSFLRSFLFLSAELSFFLSVLLVKKTRCCGFAVQRILFPGFECRSETDLPAGIAKAVNAPARKMAASLFSAFGDGKFLSPTRNLTPRGKKWRMV